MSSRRPATPVQIGLAEAIERARGLAASGQRRLLGIAGAPASGKSTLASAVVATLGGGAVTVPLDGFHLADVQLDTLGRAGRKGAPDTFDAWGYVALLERLRTPAAGQTVYAPAFERTLEQPIAGSIAVDPATPLVVTEGNYLLLDTQPWQRIAPLLDEVWWVDVDDELRHHRLVARHVRFGKEPAVARDWVREVDDVNARLVASGRDRADVIVRLDVAGESWGSSG